MAKRKLEFWEGVKRNKNFQKIWTVGLVMGEIDGRQVGLDGDLGVNRVIAELRGRRQVVVGFWTAWEALAGVDCHVEEYESLRVVLGVKFVTANRGAN